jgi:hypothetical protein
MAENAAAGKNKFLGGSASPFFSFLITFIRRYLIGIL